MSEPAKKRVRLVCNKTEYILPADLMEIVMTYAKKTCLFCGRLFYESDTTPCPIDISIWPCKQIEAHEDLYDFNGEIMTIKEREIKEYQENLWLRYENQCKMDRIFFF
jgi:hypothetical protein